MTGYGDDVYQPDPTNEEFVEQLDDSDTLIDGVGDPLDEGYSPPDHLIRVREHESLDQRLADENPDPAAAGDLSADGDGIGDAADTDGELRDDQVGGPRSGRLVAPNEGFGEDYTSDMVARDVGIDGGAASAEEAAVHIVEGDDEIIE